MNIVMIAVHKNGNKIIGFRLLDTDSGKIQDLALDNVKTMVSMDKRAIENLRIKQCVIMGSNGAFQR